jgi:hypothetical protein
MWVNYFAFVENNYPMHPHAKEIEVKDSPAMIVAIKFLRSGATRTKTTHTLKSLGKRIDLSKLTVAAPATSIVTYLGLVDPEDDKEVLFFMPSTLVQRNIQADRENRIHRLIILHVADRQMFK